MTNLESLGNLSNEHAASYSAALTSFYSFDGLYGFKKKFAPNWDSRYLVYGSHGDLLRYDLRGFRGALAATHCLLVETDSFPEVEDPRELFGLDHRFFTRAMTLLP